MILRLLLLAGLFAVTVPAQFLIRVEQGGRAFTVANGGSISINSGGILRLATAQVIVTYLGNTQLNFTQPAQLIGSLEFSSPALGRTSLRPLESRTIEFEYLPRTAEATAAQFSWTFSEDPRDSTQPATNGVLSLALLGSAPNLIVGTAIDGNVTAIGPGSVLPLPEVLVNTAIDVPVSVSNRGSGLGTVTGITLTGTDFQVVGLPLLPFSILPGTDLSFVVRFSPRRPGVLLATLQINFETRPTLTATIRGTALSSAFTYELIQDGLVAPLAIDGTVNFGEVTVGQRSAVTIRFRNAATVPATLANILVSGLVFGITEGPFVPVLLQPGETRTFNLVFAPQEPGAATGRLLVGNDGFAVSGRGLGPLLRYSYDVGNVTLPVLPQAVLSFPPLEPGRTASLVFQVANRGTAPGSVISAGVLDTRGVFRLRGLPPLPFSLGPDEVLRFAIDFSPLSAGQATTTLLVDGVAFTLSGFSSAPPPLPAYSFTGAAGPVPAFVQPSIGLTLAEPYSQPLRGQLTLSVTPENFVIDPAVVFSSGGRIVPFTIAAGSREAIFAGGSNRIQFQTGTVAGTIQFEPTFVTEAGTDLTPVPAPRLSLPVSRAAPVLLTARLASRSTSGLSILVTGYATTRTVTTLEFEFFGGEGANLATARFSVNVAAESAVWFQSQTSQSAGGQFAVEVPFTLRLDDGSGAGTDLSTRIQRVTVRAVNDLGPSNLLSVPIP